MHVQTELIVDDLITGYGGVKLENDGWPNWFNLYNPNGTADKRRWYVGHASDLLFSIRARLDDGSSIAGANVNIDHAGNVGIGTGNVELSNKLDVGGKAKVDDTLTAKAGLDVSGLANFIGGVRVDTASGTNPLNVSRVASSVSQVLQMWVADRNTHFRYVEDTTAEGTGNFGGIIFDLAGNDGEADHQALRIDQNGAEFSGRVSAGTTRASTGELTNRLALEDGAVARLYEADGSHYASINARVDEWLHKFFRRVSDNATLRYGEQWYDGASYHTVHVDAGGFVFGSQLQTSGGVSLTGSSVLQHNATASYDKIRVWSATSYTIGMNSPLSYGYLGGSYAMTFTMNNDASRGWLWRHTGHSGSQGAMSLTTDGKLYVPQVKVVNTMIIPVV